MGKGIGRAERLSLESDPDRPEGPPVSGFTGALLLGKIVSGVGVEISVVCAGTAGVDVVGVGVAVCSMGGGTDTTTATDDEEEEEEEEEVEEKDEGVDTSVDISLRLPFIFLPPDALRAFLDLGPSDSSGVSGRGSVCAAGSDDVSNIGVESAVCAVCGVTGMLELFATLLELLLLLLELLLLLLELLVTTGGDKSSTAPGIGLGKHSKQTSLQHGSHNHLSPLS